ncbi:tetratricopeptide repeat protein [Spirosoma soli]|uniref:Tetratricopeptide repeat protein n=1 Tax=Spirosoma soli TaxID=1770529 RepID=A0ABW5LZG9_9BACT
METQQGLKQTSATAGLSTFLSFGAKSVQPEILEKMLIGREKTADLLTKYVREIATNGVNHQVFMVGPRGAGKTHLLRVLYHRITDLVQSRQVVVAYCAEEEYGISGYLDFLIRIINAFMRWYDTDKIQLEEQLDILRETPERRQEAVAETLISDYVGDKPLLILSENFDNILEALGEKGQSKLRAWLYRHNRISIIATAQAISPDLGREDRPFYGFFSPIYLKKLSYEDSLALLTTLAETEKNPTMLEHLAGKGRAQVRAIHELVKGNHRLLVTFYEFLKADTLADLSVIFMKTMNDLKPYYETFIRYLPAQQQKILHYLALAKTPQKGTDIAKNCFIGTTSLTKQLSELQRQHLIDALTDPSDKRNKLYDISEPLLRIAIEIGEQREGITSLFIDFLALYYSHDEIKNQKARFEDLYQNEVEPSKKQKLYWEVEAREKALRLQMELGVRAETSYPEIKELIELGNIYHEQNKYAEAISVYKQAVEINPKSEIAWYGLGSSFYWLNDYEQAISAYKKATQIKSDFESAWHNMGLAHINQQEYQQVHYAFSKVIELNPSNITAWRNLGIIYVMQEDYDQALNAFLKIIQLNPDDPFAWNNLGATYDELGERKLAFKAFLRSTQLKPDYIIGWYNLASAYSQQDNYRQAIEAYQKAIDLEVDDTGIEDLAETIRRLLQNQTATELELTNLELWLQNRAGLEIITSYVNVYRRLVFNKEEKALYELPKEQREFFEREILKRSVD